MARKEYPLRRRLAAGLLTAGLVAATAGVASAQDAAKIAPRMYQVIFEDQHDRVIDYHLKPGEKEPMHSHPNGVLVYWFTNAKTRNTFPDGRTSDSASNAGDVVWRDPVTHRGENVGTSEIHELLVEPLTPCKPAAQRLPAPAEDAVRLAPQMYRVIFENDRYRVIDYHLQAGGKEPMHSHPNGVLVYWFSDAKMRSGPYTAGQVLWREPVTHRGENIGQTEAHSLLVEPKSTCR